MNIIGKILVILNLVFAVIVGGFLVVDFATRTNWREAHDNLQKEMKVAQGNWDAGGNTLGKALAENKQILAQRDAARQEIVDNKTLYDLELNKRDKDRDAAKIRADEAVLTMQRYQAEAERLSKESQFHLDLLRKKEDKIVEQQGDITKFRSAAIALEGSLKASLDRLEQSQTRIAELEQNVNKIKSGATGGERLTRGQENPPSVYVEGKIEAIDAQDPSMVQLDVGSDKGLSPNHTLVAYRVAPTPTYLGVIRIVDVAPHHAVGKLERTGAARTPSPLRVGDTVSSTLSRK